MESMIRGIRIMRRITDMAAFDNYRGEEISPGRHVESDEDLADYVRENCMTMYHPTTTCRMGIDETAVVDPASLKVRGLDGLRVIDASVMPTVVSGNTLAATVCVAEKGADLIKG